LPIWRLLEGKKREQNFNDITIELIRHAWLLRDKNFLNKNNFALPRLESLVKNTFYFDTESYWQESIYELIRAQYFDFYYKNLKMEEKFLEQYLDAAFLTVMETYQLFNLEYFIRNDLLFLSSGINLLDFLQEQTDQGNIIFLLCYSNDLINSNPDGWFDFLEKFCDKLLKVGDTFKREKFKKSIGVLVNYDMHKYLAELETFQDFYGKYYLINNYFADDDQEQEDLDKTHNYCDQLSKTFIEGNYVN
jgi:hypothetical protein